MRDARCEVVPIVHVDSLLIVFQQKDTMYIELQLKSKQRPL